MEKYFRNARINPNLGDMVVSTPISIKNYKQIQKNVKPGCETRPRTDQSKLRDMVAPRTTLTRTTKTNETWTSKLESKLKRDSRYYTNFKQKIMKLKTPTFQYRTNKNDRETVGPTRQLQRMEIKNANKKILKRMSKSEPELIGQTQLTQSLLY